MTATIALTAAEITDARLDVISRAREVLVRARSEHGAWRGSASLLRVTAAMAALQGAVRCWETASRDELDAATRMVAHSTVQVIAVVEDVMGVEAATYVAGEGEVAGDGF